MKYCDLQPRFCHTHTHTCIQTLLRYLWDSRLDLLSYSTAALPALCTRLSLTPSPAHLTHSHTHLIPHTSTLPLFYFSPPSLVHIPLPVACQPHRSSPKLHVPRPGPVCFHSPPGGQVIWGRERESRWPLAPDLFSLNLTPRRRVRRMWQSG